ncbi:MAG: sigma-70 family RNA polymerase sigma factor [Sedimentisphaerales bacterium]|nr:sigma-70 family RNA polymerase sigma factor [Sedimentisphaerales bacterium]
MAKIVEQTNDDLVLRARTQSSALGQLYELYYERIFRFCVHRLFIKEIAEDVTSTIFLEVAKQIRDFSGNTEKDFENWLYAIVANHTNAYIRKNSRRKKLLEEATRSIKISSEDNTRELDWPCLYAAIVKLKPKYQTIITLRFFENLPYTQIAQILQMKETTLRVTVHRILDDLRNELKSVFGNEV